MSLRFAVVVVVALAHPVSAQEAAESLPPFDDNAPKESPQVEAPGQVYEMFLQPDATLLRDDDGDSAPVPDPQQEVLEKIKQSHQAAHAARLEILKLRLKSHQARFDELTGALREQRELQVKRLGDHPAGKAILAQFDKMQSGAVARLESAKSEIEAAIEQAKEVVNLRRQREASALGELYRQHTFGDIDMLALVVEFERAELSRLTAQHALAEMKSAERVAVLQRTARQLREHGQSDAAEQIEATTAMLGYLATPEPAYAPLRLSPAKTTPFQIDEGLLDLPKEAEPSPAKRTQE
ncbi:MAG: hypothetical protein SGJ19_22670 [Planctomycetia bacterium]|nr:hypothetical protein [Planctomycetia bacterium]